VPTPPTGRAVIRTGHHPPSGAPFDGHHPPPARHRRRHRQRARQAIGRSELPALPAGLTYHDVPTALVADVLHAGSTSHGAPSDDDGPVHSPPPDPSGCWRIRRCA